MEDIMEAITEMQMLSASLMDEASSAANDAKKLGFIAKSTGVDEATIILVEYIARHQE